MAETTTDKTTQLPFTSKATKQLDLKRMWQSLPTAGKVVVGLGAAYLLMLIASKLLSAGADLKNSLSKFKGAGAPPTIH